MGRPSKLSDPIREEAVRRLAAGEGIRAVGRDMGIPYATMRRNFSAHVPEVANVAKTIAAGRVALKKLPVTDQRAALSLADTLSRINADYADIAATQAAAGRQVSARLSAQAENLPDEPTAEDLRPIAAGAETVKALLAPATSLIAAGAKNLVETDDMGKKINVTVSFPTLEAKNA